MNNIHDKDLVYYGPHPCQECDPTGENGTMIVKAGDIDLNFVHGSHYPNHEWQKHEHIEKGECGCHCHKDMNGQNHFFNAIEGQKCDHCKDRTLISSPTQQ